MQPRAGGRRRGNEYEFDIGAPSRLEIELAAEHGLQPLVTRDTVVDVQNAPELGAIVMSRRIVGGRRDQAAADRRELARERIADAIAPVAARNQRDAAMMAVGEHPVRHQPRLLLRRQCELIQADGRRRDRSAGSSAPAPARIAARCWPPRRRPRASAVRPRSCCRPRAPAPMASGPGSAPVSYSRSSGRVAERQAGSRRSGNRHARSTPAPPPARSAAAASATRAADRRRGERARERLRQHFERRMIRIVRAPACRFRLRRQRSAARLRGDGAELEPAAHGRIGARLRARV